MRECAGARAWQRSAMYANKVEYNVRVRALAKRDAWHSVFLYLSPGEKEGSSWGPETRARSLTRPVERWRQKRRGQHGRDGEEWSVRKRRGRKGRPKARGRTRENWEGETVEEKKEEEEKEEGRGQCQRQDRQGGRHSRPIIIIARHNSAGLSTSPGTDWAIEPPRPGAEREKGRTGKGWRPGEGEDYRLLRGSKEKKKEGLRERNCPPLKESHRTTHKFISNLYITAHYLNPPRTSSIVSRLCTGQRPLLAVLTLWRLMNSGDTVRIRN